METGLQIKPRTATDTRIINEAIEEAGFYAEYNSEWGIFFLPEELETYDDLERQLVEILDPTDADYRIEGIF